MKLVFTKMRLDRIEEAEKNGTPFFWCKPWTGGAKLPISYTNQKAYNGVNFAILDAGEYITFKALQEYKGTLSEEEAEKVKIKKGSHKQPVFFMSAIDKKDADGNVEESEIDYDEIFGEYKIKNGGRFS